MPARLVWTRQVVGEGDDPFVIKPKHRLMAYDNVTAEERIVLGELGAYRKPMLNHNGERIIFSNPKEHMVYQVDWSGENVKQLAKGQAVDLWVDPETGIEWVYALERFTEPGSDIGKGLYRFQLDDPKKREAVWNNTPVSVNTFQVSANGKYAAGLFPWPKAGILDLEKKHLRRAAKGCWVAMSPGNQYRYWVFDGAHKNIMLAQVGQRGKAKVAINTAPNTVGYEMYHPRWSNHPRFMLTTGPYKIKKGVNAIGGGGDGINIYLGRFDEEYKAIDHWVQLTDAKEADFFPDMWIQGGDEGVEVAPLVETEEKVVESGSILFQWENARADNTIRLVNDEEYYGETTPVGGALLGRHFEMLTGGGFFKTDPLPYAIHEAINNEKWMFNFSLLFKLAEDSANAPLFVWGEEGQESLLSLSQEGSNITLKALGATGEVSVVLTNVAANTYHGLSVAFDQKHIATFLDRRPSVEAPFAPVVWTNTPPLYFGAVAGGATPFWKGSLEGFVLRAGNFIYADHDDWWAGWKAKLKTREVPERYTVKAELVQTSDTPTPAAIAPYRSCLVEYHYRLLEPVEGFVDEEFVVQHWGMLDTEDLELPNEVGAVHTLVLENVSDHPELEGERVSSGLDNPFLNVYLDMKLY